MASGLWNYIKGVINGDAEYTFGDIGKNLIAYTYNRLHGAEGGYTDGLVKAYEDAEKEEAQYNAIENSAQDNNIAETNNTIAENHAEEANNVADAKYENAKTDTENRDKQINDYNTADWETVVKKMEEWRNQDYEREDTALERALEQLKKAGLNPKLAYDQLATVLGKTYSSASDIPTISGLSNGTYSAATSYMSQTDLTSLANIVVAKINSSTTLEKTEKDQLTSMIETGIKTGSSIITTMLPYILMMV